MRPSRSPKRFLDRLMRDTARTFTAPTGAEAFLHALRLHAPVIDRFRRQPAGTEGPVAHA
ncbi:hypothetical protein BIV25_02060 [Streptomyces sp. MUSC 14]|uniref:hypothetical protein n=1 Tax=Streptomyces sp. MUSC 14 TaxID=1354889 RepID=UPI0008F580E5|nr:hypothetical protein [Streptomyces sp. MUSC 14]OIK02410.1 hypothetical protein BIV25_02060 [Streptomyces sp. MUSC 14]